MPFMRLSEPDRQVFRNAVLRSANLDLSIPASNSFQSVVHSILLAQKSLSISRRRAAQFLENSKVLAKIWQAAKMDREIQQDVEEWNMPLRISIEDAVERLIDTNNSTTRNVKVKFPKKAVSFYPRGKALSLLFQAAKEQVTSEQPMQPLLMLALK